MITNEAGTVIERLGYDAQFVFAPAAQVGKRRYANDEQAKRVAGRRSAPGSRLTSAAMLPRLSSRA